MTAHRAILLLCLVAASCEIPLGLRPAAAWAADEGGTSVVTGRVEGAPAGTVVTLRRVADVIADRIAARTRKLGAHRREDGPAFTVRTGDDGSFRCEGLPTGEYLASVRNPLDDDVEEWVSLRPNQGFRRVLLRLRPAEGDARVTGRIVVDGVAVAGARVKWTPRWNGAVRPTATVRTGADGRFEIRGLADRDGFLDVSKDGAFSRNVLRPPEPDGADVDPLAGLATVSVRVVDAQSGASVQGALVATGSYGTVHGSTTSGDGTALVRCAQADVWIAAEATGFLPADLEFVAPPASVVVRMRRDVPVVVRVVDAASGAPAAGARVMAQTLFRSSESITAADATGTATLRGLRPGDLCLRVVGGGWVSAGPMDTDRDLGELFSEPEVAARTVVLRAVRSVSLRGLVTGPDGEAVEGANVGASGGDWTCVPRARPGDWGRAVTGADGTFRIDDLRPDVEVAVWAHVPDAPNPPLQRVTPHADRTAPLSFVVERCGFVRVLVVDAQTGSPLPRTSVSASVRRLPGQGPPVSAEGATGADGRATLGPLPFGRCSVRVAFGPGLEGSPREADVGGDEEVVVEAPHTESMSGRVVDDEGRAPPFATVRLARRDGNGATSYVIVEGRFAASRLVPGSYDVAVEATRDGIEFAGHAVATTGGEPFVVRLAPTGPTPRTRRIRVVGTDGRSVASARFSIHQQQGGGGQVCADGLAVRSPEDGAVLMVWNAVDASGSAVGLGAYLGPVPEDGVVRLAAERVVRGVVRDAGGAPVAGLVVSATPVDPRVPGIRSHGVTPDDDGWRVYGTAVTARDGSFTIRGLGTMRYAVIAGPTHEFEESRPSETDAGGSVDLVVARRPPR